MIVEKAWFEKYRAKDIDEYIFPNEEIKKFAKESYDNELIPGNVLFYGPPGVGKSNLAQILLKKIIKDTSDLFVLRERSVKEIDQVKIWMKKPAVKSKQKIVFAEEADRLLQSKQLIAELKTITEKYIPKVIFFFITNYISKFSSADSALLSRFTYKFFFNIPPQEKVVEKLKKILEEEKIKYDEKKLVEFVEQHKNLGIRDLINKIQLACLNGEFNPKAEIVRAPVVEEAIVELFTHFMNELISITNKEVLNALLYTNNFMVLKDLKISELYFNIIRLLQNDQLIDYEYVLNKILENVEFIPFYKVVLQYLEELPFKKFKNLHLIALLYELVKVRYEFA
jgi:DNA polymerase III delta prime subunit